MINKFYIESKEFEVSTEYQEVLTIDSHPKPYKVYFKKFENYFSNNQVVLVDKNVKEKFNIQHSKLIEIEAIEDNKSIETVLEVCQKLIEFKFDKGNTLIVIGGGIIQDIGAFVGKSFKRGIKWIYVPTTLLSQCDSCIGGKTALNFNGFKNQLALFSAPEEVIIDTDFLKTLSDQDITSGYGEIVKLFLIGGEWYVDNMEKFDMKERIFHSLSIKKSVIEFDEFENNERKSLNYGHSFGHVIEPIMAYTIPHGEAVLLGIEIINKLFSKSDKISNLINRYSSLEKIRGVINVESMIDKLTTDKKVSSGVISFVVVDEIGKTKFMNHEINKDLKQKVHEILVN